MWATFAAALFATLRRRLHLRPQTWRIGHTFLVLIVVGTLVHASLIEGTMETVLKAALCALILVETMKVIADLRVWSNKRRSEKE